MFKLTKHTHGPILRPDAARPWEAEGVFNPGVVKSGDTIYMLYRAVGEKEAYISHLGLATSKDGVTFTRVGDRPVFGPHKTYDKWATEDPRVTEIDGDFYVTYVALSQRVMENGEPPKRDGTLETSTALLKTKDFLSYEEFGVISPLGSDNKDIVLFPKKINGRHAMLHRPNRWVSGQSPLPSIWMAFSDDFITWTDHRLFLTPTHHDDAKIGPGIPPIETKDGWLIIYHHVTRVDDSDKLIYTARAALFDLKDPTRLIGKLPYDILFPEEPYETENGMQIVFPTGGCIMDDTLYVYYGASDRYVCLATGSLSELLREIKKEIKKK